MTCASDPVSGPRLTSRAAATLLIALCSLPSLALAEDENGEPVEYQVIEDPEPADQPPPPPGDYGQQAQPTYGQPAQTQGPVVAAPVVTAQPGTAAPATPAPGSYRTGVSGGVFFSYSPQGRIANFDSSSAVVGTADFPATAGFGGHIAGLGRHFGGGAQARAVWVYDLNTDSTWSITDVQGMLRGRGRWGRFEFYGEMDIGFCVQRISYASSTSSAGGMAFGAGLGFRVFANDFLSFFVEPGMLWRIIFDDATSTSTTNTLGIRQFTLEIGINFGA
jgi:hypothetical protein